MAGGLLAVFPPPLRLHRVYVGTVCGVLVYLLKPTGWLSPARVFDLSRDFVRCF